MYQQTQNPDIIQRTSDKAFIPTDPANRDYKEFLAWQVAGGVIAPYTPPAQTATEIEIAQLKLAVVDINVPLSQKFNALLKLLGYMAL